MVIKRWEAQLHQQLRPDLSPVESQDCSAAREVKGLLGDLAGGSSASCLRRGVGGRQA